MLGAPPGKVDACIVPDRVSHTASEAATREAAMVQPFPPPAWPTGQEVDPRRWIAEHPGWDFSRPTRPAAATEIGEGGEEAWSSLGQCLEKIRRRADRPRGGWGELSSRYCAGIAAGSGWGWGSARLSTCAWLGAGEWGMHTHDCCHTHMHELICGSVRCDAAFQRVNRSRAAELSRRGATAKEMG